MTLGVRFLRVLVIILNKNQLFKPHMLLEVLRKGFCYHVFKMIVSRMSVAALPLHSFQILNKEVEETIRKILWKTDSHG